MNANKPYVKEVKFSQTKTGKRAYYYSTRAMRWFPLPVAEAEFFVATGQATDLTGTEAIG